ncbi:HAD family hydrolase [Actinophytocola algeriensis]|uniref:Beta-phosphoglucomutase-like phosphatase (HAD superfamily) n=1 Tax=Actinophytocola algeriensis TaxID=1768010 RepID=A0A7W7VCK9_9PSEU|nr:HAD family phosphatase [Actinophytocola algeriensis]MBB4905236.1 beta-phosphoglucomutase-like phosphatase (HAD superfamily) [Actinophytocola algeriensis]MBE1473079.1 beta-phosphoglucomutase-like phosphatase (HAD superfamily) [Actinophytocola algeriensis]
MTHDPDGLVFDLDGTLADTAVIGRAALDGTIAAFGITPTGDAMALNGMAFADRVRTMRGNGDLDDTITDADLVAECDRQLIAMAGDVRPIAPVVGILRRAHGRVPLALATGSTGPVAAAVVAAIGLAGVFDAIVTRDDVARGKPAPDCYLRAAALLGLDPVRCVAYEDTAIGLAAASAAGLSVVDVRPLVRKKFPS